MVDLADVFLKAGECIGEVERWCALLRSGVGERGVCGEGIERWVEGGEGVVGVGWAAGEGDCLLWREQEAPLVC